MAKGSSSSKSLPRVTAVPADRSSAPVLKIRLYLVLGTLIAAALLGLISTLAWVTQKPPPVDLTAAQPKAQGFAALVADAYLDGRPLAVPLAEDVEGLTSSKALEHEPPQWTGFSSARMPSGLLLEKHRFLFYRLFPPPGEGQPPLKVLYELTVPVTFGAGNTPALGADPYFAPVVFPDVEGSTGYGDANEYPSAAVETLRKWAQAWAANDTNQLKLLAGDGTENVTYLGLSGFTAESLTVLSAVPAGNGTWLVRARVSLKSPNGFASVMDLDITTVGIPPDPTTVVGWGPAGSGLLGPDSVRVPSQLTTE